MDNGDYGKLLSEGGQTEVHDMDVRGVVDSTISDFNVLVQGPCCNLKLEQVVIDVSTWR